MDFSLLAVCILSCFRVIRADNDKKVDNIRLNDSAIHTQNVQRLPTGNRCSSLFQETFKSEICGSQEELKGELRFRCQLIDEIKSVCRQQPDFDPKTKIRNVSSSLCEQETQKNRSDVPLQVNILLSLWNSQDSVVNCKTICAPIEGRTYSVCDFIINFYNVQFLSSKSKSDVSTKTKPSSKNDEDISKSRVVDVSANDEDRVDNETYDRDENLAPASLDEKLKAANQPNVVKLAGSEKAEIPVPDPKEEVPKEEIPKEEVPKEEIPKEEVPKEKHALKSEKNRENSQNKGTSINGLEEDSHAFSYFMLISGLCIIFYFMMYNKKKILALVIEGRRRNVKRRPNSAAYSKLDCNLEEAMASGPSTSTSNTLLY